MIFGGSHSAARYLTGFAGPANLNYRSPFWVEIHLIPSLREKTSNLRRQHILEAASAVFAERGFERATIKDIARAAGIADGSIYNVFENKSALLEALLERLSSATDPAEAPVGSEAPVGLGELLRRRWRAFSPDTLQMMRAVLAEALVDEDLRRHFHDRVLAPVLKSATAPAGRLSDDDGEITQRAIVGALLGVTLLRLLGDDVVARRWDEFPDRLADLFENGMQQT